MILVQNYLIYESRKKSEPFSREKAINKNNIKISKMLEPAGKNFKAAFIITLDNVKENAIMAKKIGNITEET